MATIREVKKELRHHEWAEEIAECHWMKSHMAAVILPDILLSKMHPQK